MARASNTGPSSLIERLMTNDAETMEWLRKLELITIDPDGNWNATELASAVASRSHLELAQIAQLSLSRSVREREVPPTATQHG